MVGGNNNTIANNKFLTTNITNASAHFYGLYIENTIEGKDYIWLIVAGFFYFGVVILVADVTNILVSAVRNLSSS